MSVIDTLRALAITVRNEKKKEANSAIRIGDLFLAIIDFIKGLASGQIRQEGVDTYNDTSGGKTSLLNKYPNPQIGWTVLVRNDETNGGKALLYQWNGSIWINLETVIYYDDIVSKTEYYNNNKINKEQIPFDGFTTPGKGLSAANNKFIFDANRNGWVMQLSKGIKYDGQHLYAFRNVPVWYDKDLPHEITVNLLVKSDKKAINFSYSHGVIFQNHVGGSVADLPFSNIQVNAVEAESGESNVMFSMKVNLEDIASIENSRIESKSYILISAYFQVSVQDTTSSKDEEIWIADRSMYLSGFSNRNYQTYVENKVLINGKGTPIPFMVENTVYPDSDNGRLVSHIMQNGGTIESGSSAFRKFLFDTRIQVARYLNDNTGSAFLLRIKFETENISADAVLPDGFDDMVINNYVGVGKALPMYWNADEKEMLLRCVFSEIDFIRLIIPLKFTLTDTSKSGSVKISDISMINDVPDMLSKYYDNWDFAKSLNNGNPITAISEWQKKTESFPIKLSTFVGEQFYGAEMDNRIGRLFIPRRIQQQNPNYISVLFNKDVWKGLVKDVSGQPYPQKKVMVFSWFVKYRFIGHNLNGQDDSYYNSYDFVTANNLIGGASANPAGTALASGAYMYFPAKGMMDAEPYFIVRYEYYINMDSDATGYNNTKSPILYSVIQNKPDLAGLDLEAQSLGCYVRGLEMPLFDDALSRSLKYASSIDNQATIPFQIGLASGQAKRYLTDTYGDILEGDTGTANKQVDSFVGYYSLNKPAKNEGVVVSVNINSPVAQTVDLVVGLIDQNSLIIPSIIKTVNLSAGANIIGYYNRDASPLKIKKGEQLFVRQSTANPVPYMEDVNSEYVVATNMASPVTSVVSGRKLDYRYIVDYALKPAYEIPSKVEHLELQEKVTTIEQNIANGLPLYSPDGSKFHLKVNNKGELFAYRNTFNRLCIIGNSIAWHQINEYWWGTWGMAASIREKDFAHLIWEQAKKGNPACELDSFNFAVWEVSSSEERRNLLTTVLEPHLKQNPDAIIIRLSENIQNLNNLQQDYQELLQYIKTKCPNATIIAGGTFWTFEEKDAAIKAACDAEGVSFSKQSHLDIAENRSAIGTPVYGDDGQWHTVDNEGVAGHPGDKGMSEIAKIFIKQLEI